MVLLSLTVFFPDALSAAGKEGNALQAFVCTKPLSKEQVTQSLTSAQKGYLAVNSLHADFIQESYLSALDVSEQSRGEMYFKRPGQMRWNYSVPELQHFVIRDNSIWWHQPTMNQAVIDKLGDVLLSDLPVAFLIGIGSLDKSFDASGGCETSEGLALDLKPKARDNVTEERGLKQFVLLVNKDSFLPLGARVTDFTENVTTILFQSTTHNGSIPAKTFSLAFPPGTDVQDKRKAGGANG